MATKEPTVAKGSGVNPQNAISNSSVNGSYGLPNKVRFGNGTTGEWKDLGDGSATFDTAKERFFVEGTNRRAPEIGPFSISAVDGNGNEVYNGWEQTMSAAKRRIVRYTTNKYK